MRAARAASGCVLGLSCLCLLGSVLLAGVGEARDGEPVAAGPGRLAISVDGGLLTVRALDVSLRDLLEAITLESGLAADLRGPLDERVTLELERLPMRQALRRILENRNFVLRYRGPSSAAGPAGELWVVASGSRGAPLPEPVAAYKILTHDWPGLASDDAGTRLATVSELAAAGDASETLAAVALYDADAAVREEAVYGLGTAVGEPGVPMLERALTDPAPRVRRAAVDALADRGGEESAWALAAALDDDDASLREQAVHALGEIGGEAAAALLRQALADEQDFVRQSAAEALAELAGDG